MRLTRLDIMFLWTKLRSNNNRKSDETIIQPSCKLEQAWTKTINFVVGTTQTILSGQHKLILVGSPIRTQGSLHLAPARGTSHPAIIISCGILCT